mmetsp:Transcript_30185/g.65025  ORF Transcript_30185/g.65025 Transcript_30185/m.65025 type:complete len:238 (-) Transcript_30185:1300-2013(-)
MGSFLCFSNRGCKQVSFMHSFRSLMNRMEERSHLLSLSAEEDGQNLSKLAVVYAEGSRLWVMPSRIGKGLSALVWIMVLFADFSLFFLVFRGHILFIHAVIVSLLTQLILWSHIKCMLTNPGTVPINAQPLKLVLRPAFCARCQCYKPPRSHHDHASGRCISRMDHHCPWTNNVIALRNQKHFLLFLIYADIAAVYIYGLVLWTVVRTALPCNNENVNTASLSNKPHSRFLNQDHGG